MVGLWQDVRYGLRMLLKARGVMAIALMMLVLGIAASTAIFTLVNAVLLRPVPGLREPERLVRFVRLQSGDESTNFGYPDYLDFRDRSRTFSGVVCQGQAALSITHDISERVPGVVVSGNYFQVLGVQAALGRLLTPDDDRTPGAHPLAVISHAFWRRAFGSNPSVIGRPLKLNGSSFTVIGVAPEEFYGTAIGDRIDVWVPIAMTAQAIPRFADANPLGERAWGWISIWGRLKPGVSVKQASAETRVLAERLAREYPRTNEGRSVDVRTGIGLTPGQRSNLQRFLSMLLGAVCLLLLIACSNVANLLLARASARQREMAVRLALGAGRARLFRQLLVESTLLGLLAAGIGLLITPWTLQLLATLLPPSDSAFRAPASVDLRVFAFALAVGLLSTLLFGLAPLLAALRTHVSAVLKDSAPSSGRGGGHARRILVVVQVALSLVLLIAAGLIVRTMQRILAIDRGFEAEGMLLASVDLSVHGYDEARARLLFSQIPERLEGLPGVRSVSLGKTDPVRGWGDRRSIFYPGQEPSQDVLRRRSDIGIRVECNTVSPGYYHNFGIALLAGRDFGPQDTVGAPPVGIVNRKLAERLWPGENPIGQRIAVPNYTGPPRPPVTIVGVTANSRHRTLLADAPLLLYQPLAQNHEVFVKVQVRTEADPVAFTPILRRELAAIDPNLTLFDIHSLSEQIGESLWQQQTAAGLIGLFGSIAAFLASIGLYSVMAYAVARRKREIGIRMALGATRRNVVGLVLRSGFRLVLAGVTVGVVGALFLTRFVAAYLYGVERTDAMTFVTATLLMTAVALAASYLPARTATLIDPAIALRHE